MNIKLPMYYDNINKIYAVVKDNNEYFIAVISNIAHNQLNSAFALKTSRSKSLVDCFNYTFKDRINYCLKFNQFNFEYEISLQDSHGYGVCNIIMYDTTYEKLLIKCKELIPEEFL